MRNKIMPILLIIALASLLFLFFSPVWNAIDTVGKKASVQINNADASSEIMEIVKKIEKMKILFIFLTISMALYLPVPCIISYRIICRWLNNRKKDGNRISSVEKAALTPAEKSVPMIDPDHYPDAFESETDENTPVVMYEEPDSDMVTVMLMAAEKNEEPFESTYIPVEQDTGDIKTEAKHETEPQQNNKKIHPRKTGRRKEKNYEKPASRKKDRGKKRGNSEPEEQLAVSESMLPQ